MRKKSTSGYGSRIYGKLESTSKNIEKAAVLKVSLSTELVFLTDDDSIQHEESLDTVFTIVQREEVATFVS